MDYAEWFVSQTIRYGTEFTTSANRLKLLDFKNPEWVSGFWHSADAFAGLQIAARTRTVPDEWREVHQAFLLALDHMVQYSAMVRDGVTLGPEGAFISDRARREAASEHLTLGGAAFSHARDLFEKKVNLLTEKRGGQASLPTYTPFPTPAPSPTPRPLPKLDGIGVTAGIKPVPLPGRICPTVNLDIKLDKWGTETLTISNEGNACEIDGLQLKVFPLTAPTMQLLSQEYLSLPIKLAVGEVRTLSLRTQFFDSAYRQFKDIGRVGDIGCRFSIPILKVLWQDCISNTKLPAEYIGVHFVKSIAKVISELEASGVSVSRTTTLNRLIDAEQKLIKVYESWNITDPSPSIPVAKGDSITISLWDADPRVPPLDSGDLRILSELGRSLSDAPQAFSQLNELRPDFLKRDPSCADLYKQAGVRIIPADRLGKAVTPDFFISSATSLRAAQACLGERVYSSLPTATPVATVRPGPGATRETAIKLTYLELAAMLEKDREATIGELTGKWVYIRGETTGTTGASGDGGIVDGKQQFLFYSFSIAASKGMKYAYQPVECIGERGDTAIRDFNVLPIREVAIVGIYKHASTPYTVLNLVPLLNSCTIVP